MKISPILISRAATIGIVLLWGVSIFLAFDGGTFSNSAFLSSMGWGAWWLLAYTIFVSLLQKLTRLFAPRVSLFTRLLPSRKVTGIFAFLMATAHVCVVLVSRGGSILYPGMWDTLFATDQAQITGFIGWLILLPLFLTSTKWAMKTMGGKAWKRLQRMVHVAFLFIGMHIAMVDFMLYKEVDVLPLVVLILYVLGYTVLFLKKKASTHS